MRALERWRGLLRHHGLRGIQPAVERALAVCRAAKGDRSSAEIERDLTRAPELAESLGAAPKAAQCRLALARLAEGQSP